MIVTDKPFSPRARWRSFGYALEGLAYLIRTQHNAWLHLAATIAVATAGAVCRISAADWRWLIAAIGLVWFAEAINTAFEALCDVASPGFHPFVKVAKDVAAGAVLIAAITATLIGIAIFAPYVFAAAG